MRKASEKPRKIGLPRQFLVCFSILMSRRGIQQKILAILAARVFDVRKSPRRALDKSALSANSALFAFPAGRVFSSFENVSKI
jgi:hypothetical protein